LRVKQLDWWEAQAKQQSSVLLSPDSLKKAGHRNGRERNAAGGENQK